MQLSKRLAACAGKTQTMMGDLGAAAGQGLAPRIFAHLFKRIAEEEQSRVRDCQWMSAIHVYC